MPSVSSFRRVAEFFGCCFCLGGGVEIRVAVRAGWVRIFGCQESREVRCYIVFFAGIVGSLFWGGSFAVSAEYLRIVGSQ